MKKRIFAIFLTVILIVAFVGCGKSNKRKIVHLTLNTADSQTIMAAAGIYLPEPEEAAGANSVVKWLSWYDLFHNYSEDEIIHTGMYTFEHRYNSDVEWIECDYQERFNMLAQLILATTPPDFTPAGTGATATYPMSCLKEQYQPVDDYIDYDDPLWAQIKEMADYFVLGGKHYSIVYDIAVSNVIPYNKRVLEDFGFEEPAELYENDEWTWSKFAEMCREFSDPDEDRFALDGYAYAGAMVESTGQQMLQLTPDGKLYSNIDSPEIERAENLIYDLAKDDCTYSKGWSLRNNAQFGAGVKEGLCLFYTIGISFFTAPVEEVSNIWGDIENGELMFAPLPRDDNGDGNYYLCSTINGFAIVNNCDNPEGVALLGACCRFKIIDPTVVDIDKKQLKEIYLWNQDMLDMYDTCYNLALAHQRISLTGDLTDNLNRLIGEAGTINNAIIRSANPSTWAQIKEQNRENLNYAIDEYNAIIDDFNNGIKYLG